MRHHTKLISSYAKNKSGTVAPVFGLMVIPMLAITGGAIDIGKAISGERALQSAVDSAALAVCSSAPDAAPENVVRAFLASGISSSDMVLAGTTTTGKSADPIVVTLTQTGFNANENSVNPIAKGVVPTTLLKLAGIDSIDINASTKVGCGSKKLELSMVLDVTGSMDSSSGGRKKIDAMKEASIDVLDIFKRNMTAGATRVALVPFSDSVNVGSSIANKVRGTVSSGTSQNPGAAQYEFKVKKNKYKTYKITNCVSERVGGHAYKNTVPSCSGNNCTHPVGRVYMNGGVCRPSNEFKPLSGNYQNLKDTVNSFKADGWTAGHIGAMWGWYALLNDWGQFWPGAEAEVTNPDEVIKATIIMTDGVFNTQYLNGVQDRDRSGSAPNGSSNSQFSKTCDAIKADNIDVYTVGFGLDPNSDTAARLKTCASDPSKFLITDDPEKLSQAFRAISRQLSAGQVIVEN